MRIFLFAVNVRSSLFFVVATGEFLACSRPPLRMVGEGLARFFVCPRLFESLEQVRKFKTSRDGATMFSSAWPKLLGFLGCETEIKTPKRIIKTARCPEPLKIPHCTTRENLASHNLFLRDYSQILYMPGNSGSLMQKMWYLMITVAYIENIVGSF